MEYFLLFNVLLAVGASAAVFMIITVGYREFLT
jgi:hypothetical protein